MLFSRHPGILSRITGALQNSGLMEMWPSRYLPFVYNKKRKLVQICSTEDLTPPLKKRRLCGPMKRKAEPTPAEEPPLKKRRLCGPMKRKAEPAPAEEPPLKRRRLLSPEEINADEPADRNRRRYFELVSPLPTIPEEEEEIEGTDEEVRSEDAVVAPATTAPATEEPTIESVNVREEEVQEQPEDASVPATEEPATESTNEDEVPTEESAASAASTASTNVSEEEGQPQGTTDETLTDPEVAQDVSAFTTFRYGSGFFSCETKHGRRAVRRSLRVRSHQRSPPTERAPSRLDITGTVQVLDSKQRKVRRCARHLKY